MSQPPDYARHPPVEPEVLVFRRTRMIYAVGVAIIVVVSVSFGSQWPHTSNSLDPLKAEIFMADCVIGGAALTWLILGLRRILCSTLLRRDWITWVSAGVNAIVALLNLSWTTYQ